MLTISEITKQIKKVLEFEIGEIEIIGEISNYVHHQSGHKYFALKDSNAQISAVMWGSTKINFIPKNGMKVCVKGNLEVYPPQGRYQIICKRMLPAGEGDLYLAFEALKLKLMEQGYFDNNRKRPIPVLPLRVGVSTSPTGAAIQDIITTIGRRNKLIEIYFRPTLVQGDGSAEDIVKAIKELNKLNCDVIIIGRGGGSIEDLWSYNTEIVADAIYNSQTPIISAVGHESDFTISDFVADFRSSTPTAGAEAVSTITVDDILNFLSTSSKTIETSLRQKIAYYRDYLEGNVGNNLSRVIKEKLNYYKQFLDYKSSYLNSISNNILNNKTKELAYLSLRLKSNDPLLPLNKGYSLLKSQDRFIDNSQSLDDFDEIEIIRKNEHKLVKLNERR
ncbi:MAG TPA: exodeoxyribonuclease VII large subunit [Candidatus Kapabacteria bacterium]|nr:exodeoxyribonuclease VII large subunit [Candidatus Kapabacteria bacterium]